MFNMPGTLSERLKKTALISLCVIPVALLFAVILDSVFPLSVPENREGFAVTVVSENGTPMRSFPDGNGVWRYPVSVSDVSPLYIEALINYEDRWFFRHPGVNPLSLCRAARQYARSGRPVTGGSTLTMQVARIFHPHERSVAGKLSQIFRALQLEFHFSKEEILSFYLNYAPFGGPVEGVQAACYTWLGKSARELSHAEAALMAVLPQAPSRLRPDRHADRAAGARDKVIDRMVSFGVWDKDTAADAKMEVVPEIFFPRPMTSPLLARRLKGRGGPDGIVKTGVDDRLQEAASALVRNFTALSPRRTSAAVLVVDNRTMLVKAYVGSADFYDAERFGHVDMVQAVRSPGSTLKPFLYAVAMEEGLIHSESLLVDAPIDLKGYRPGNFSRNFSGPVSASEALQRSLNVPAVDLLDRLGPGFFDRRLRQGGLRLRFPDHATPDLAMILGGVGATLENLVEAYTAFAREGMAGRLRLTVSDRFDERRMMSPAAAWVVRRILRDHRRTDLPRGRLNLDMSRRVAWKTGTSYGFRDAWAIGVTDSHTVGVWTGRPDGTATPGRYGAVSAAPLLFRIVDSLPGEKHRPRKKPDNVRKVEIGWPLGLPPSGKDDSLCHVRREAWIIDDVIPPTFPDRYAQIWRKNPVTVDINPENGLRVLPGCSKARSVQKRFALWPRLARPWLSHRIRALSDIPEFDESCRRESFQFGRDLKIKGVCDHMVLRSPGGRPKLPEITLHADGGKGRLYWLLNDSIVMRAEPGESKIYAFEHPGRYRLAVIDLSGNSDAVEIIVMGGGDGGG